MFLVPIHIRKNILFLNKNLKNFFTCKSGVLWCFWLVRHIYSEGERGGQSHDMGVYYFKFW